MNYSVGKISLLKWNNLAVYKQSLPFRLWLTKNKYLLRCLPPTLFALQFGQAMQSTEVKHSLEHINDPTGSTVLLEAKAQFRAD